MLDSERHQKGSVCKQKSTLQCFSSPWTLLTSGYTWVTKQHFYVAGWKGLEPSTFCVTGRCSNQLSYHPEQTEKILSKKTILFNA